jgi:hypothetical protein
MFVHVIICGACIIQGCARHYVEMRALFGCMYIPRCYYKAHTLLVMTVRALTLIYGFHARTLFEDTCIVSC